MNLQVFLSIPSRLGTKSQDSKGVLFLHTTRVHQLVTFVDNNLSGLTSIQVMLSLLQTYSEVTNYTKYDSQNDISLLILLTGKVTEPLKS